MDSELKNRKKLLTKVKEFFSKYIYSHPQYYSSGDYIPSFKKNCNGEIEKTFVKNLEL